LTAVGLAWTSSVPFAGVGIDGQVSADRIETAPRLFFSTVNTITAGVVYLTFFTAHQDLTVSKLVSISGSTAAVGATLSKMGLYSVDSSNNLTCVARSASNTGLWALQNTVYSEAIADNGAAAPQAISSYYLRRGQRYAVAFITVGNSTAPNICSRQLPNAAMGFSLPPILCAVTSGGKTDLAASYTSASLVATSNFLYGALRV
jgi:hypothetical protein